jgi:predicted dehydrogenase
MEAFHYLYHPLMLRVEELLDEGTIGRLVHADIDMVMPPPAPTDPRWSASLAGGSLMDVGCYGLHLARYLGRWGGGPPQVVRATARQSRPHPGVDAALTAHLTYRNGSTARVRSGMRHRSVRFAFRLRGTGGSLAAPSFVLPMNDDRIIVSNGSGRFLRPAKQRVERLGTTPTYHYQLAAFADAVSTGAGLRNDLDDAVAQMELIDEAYRAAGMSPRLATEGGFSQTTG